MLARRVISSFNFSNPPQLGDWQLSVEATLLTDFEKAHGLKEVLLHYSSGQSGEATPTKCHLSYLKCECGFFDFDRYGPTDSHRVAEQNCEVPHSTRHFDDCRVYPWKPPSTVGKVPDQFSVEAAKERSHRPAMPEQPQVSETGTLSYPFNQCRNQCLCHPVTSGIETDAIRRQKIIEARLLLHGLPCPLHVLCCAHCHYTRLQPGQEDAQQLSNEQAGRRPENTSGGEGHRSKQSMPQWNANVGSKLIPLNRPAPGSCNLRDVTNQRYHTNSTAIQPRPQNLSCNGANGKLAHNPAGGAQSRGKYRWMHCVSGSSSPQFSDFEYNSSPRMIPLSSEVQDIGRDGGSVNGSGQPSMKENLPISISKAEIRPQRAEESLEFLTRDTIQVDSHMLARNILRAAGIHPTLPPLNAHLMELAGPRSASGTRKSESKRGRPPKHESGEAVPKTSRKRGRPRKSETQG